METPTTVDVVYESVRKTFPHTEFLRNEFILRFQKILGENSFYTEQHQLLVQGGDYVIPSTIPSALIKESIRKFVEIHLKISPAL